MRYLRFGILISLVVGTLVGCSKEDASGEKIAEQYVKAQGYDVISNKGEIYSYILDKSKLSGNKASLPIQQEWAVQNTEPDKYFGKEINIYGFTVSNHPLEQIYQAKTHVDVMISEGAVIGGYSFPDNDSDGACYSLDGRTLEEITGLSYIEWSNRWKKKYGDTSN